MMILDGLGFHRARCFALEQLIQCGSGDLRWAIAAVALRSFGAIWVFGQTRLVSLIRDVTGRARKAGFPEDIVAADTTVAAARS